MKTVDEWVMDEAGMRSSMDWILEFWERDISSDEAEDIVVAIRNEGKRKGAEEMRNGCAQDVLEAAVNGNITMGDLACKLRARALPGDKS